MMLVPFDSSSDDDEPPRPRIFRKRNTVADHSDASVQKHFRLPSDAIEMLSQRVHGELQSEYSRRQTDLTPTEQLSVALTYYASGDHYRTIAAAPGVSIKTVSVVVERVTDTLLRLAPEFVRMPTPHEAIAAQAGFYQVGEPGLSKRNVHLPLRLTACRA